MRRLAFLTALLLLALGALVAPAADAKRKAPPKAPADWMGVMADGPVTGDADVDLDAELALMRRNGVRVVRLPIYWSAGQPYASAADVPDGEAARGRFEDVGGVPTDFSAPDRFIAAASRHGLTVLPTVLGAPDWAAGRRTFLLAEPRDPAAYGRFLAALARRYGTRGSFRRTLPAGQWLPVRQWQVWNEPNVSAYWVSFRNPGRTFVPLLRAASRALRAADPRAEVVVGGLTNAVTPAWEALANLYRAGARGLFDVAAVHPYTGDPRNVVETLRRSRAVMRKAGDDRVPLSVTEFGWSSSGGATRDDYATWDVSEREQARRLTKGVELLARARRSLRIERILWYTWMSRPVERGAWDEYAGLRRLEGARVRSKPALRAYGRAARRVLPARVFR